MASKSKKSKAKVPSLTEQRRYYLMKLKELFDTCSVADLGRICTLLNDEGQWSKDKMWDINC